MDETVSDDVLVAVTKPVRGREMIPTTVPTDIFGSMRLESDKRTNRDEDFSNELNKLKKDNVETYYEGYVDGKKYLVPDSNLEAMKDIINLRMTKRRSTRFQHQTSLDVQDEMTPERIDKMLAKISELTISLSTVEENGSMKKSGDSKTKEESMSKSQSLCGSSRPIISKGESAESRSESQKISSLQEDAISKYKSLSRSPTSVSKADSQLRSESQKICSQQEDGFSTSKSLIRSPTSKSKADSESRSESQRISSQQKDGISKFKSPSRSPTSMSKADSESRSESQKISSQQKDGISSPLSLLLSTEESVCSEYNRKERQSEVETEEEESNDSYLRLVLSGHFKNDENPIYIIQEYNKKSPLFSRHSADFTSSQTEENVDIFVAGKLFNKNILGETDGKPTSLNLKPNKIIIDESKCKIFRSYFENTYRRKTTNITIKGEFLVNEKSMDITPFLSLKIKDNYMNMAFSDIKNEYKNEEKRPSILVKNRQSLRDSTDISKEIKRVSFKESSDDEELLHDLYKNMNKKEPDDSSFSTKVACDEKKGYLKNRGVNEHKQVIAKRKILERIFYLVTENSFFRKIFTKRK